ncbi:hypothetical protein BT96DRAFT_1017136 [Gymnopus androsaceus JB14]|uniref:Trimethylguanosine synthase n=1 Tax=Gymnopus androsaceus JB14 TaxID=1447944 RepID=A0A6A4HYF2_9AGAR|nr:hypothetical protein BT96DRAFT_1017136 [Gymnopus androsaceus JB14]
MGKRNAGFSGLARFFQQVNSIPPIESAVQNTAKRSLEPESEPPKKKKKTEVVEENTGTPQFIQKYDSKYDMTGHVPSFASMTEVPANLKKYYAQRERFFSLYSKPPGCLLDEEGWYSVTPERIADRIADRCRCDTILDAFCGVGGNAIAFAKTCQRVIALDISPTRLALARHNAQIYASRKIDVVFLSPPWGGPSYLSGSGSPTDANPPPAEEEEDPAHALFHLSAIQPIHGADLFELSRRITPNVAYYLPRNTDLNEVSGLLGNESSGEDVEEYIEVEEEWMGTKLKALTCYFGGLVDGQPGLF